MSVRFAILFAVSIVPAGVLAGQQAAFLGQGTFATESGCAQLKALSEGGDRNISTVPETLSQNGFEGWEHSCSFQSIQETEKAEQWQADVTCIEGENQWNEKLTFEKTGDQTFKVTSDGQDEAMHYAVCDAPASKQGN